MSCKQTMHQRSRQSCCTVESGYRSSSPLYRRFRVPQLVAAQLQGIWADAVADALEYTRGAVKCRHHDSIAAGIQHLLLLASEVLGDNRGGSGQQRGAAARVRDLRKRARAASTRAGATRSDSTRGKTATVEEHALAGRIHRHVRNGNDGRAAWCLDSSRMAVVDDTTMAQLKALHPPASPPVPPTVEEGPPARPRWTPTGSLASSSACRKAQHRASGAGRTSTSGRRDCTARGQGTI